MPNPESRPGAPANHLLATLPPGDYRRALECVRDEGTRLRQIVESLLLLAQPEGVRPEAEPVDLAAWVPDQIRRWAAHRRAADLRAERPVVEKEAVPVERVRLDKQTVQDQEQVNADLRKEEIEVDGADADRRV